MTTSELAKLLSIPKLPSYLKQVDELLIKSVASAAPNIKEPALRLIKSGGKRLRPCLVIAAAKSQGGEINDSVIKSCAAIELVHLSTIVHDDIIDNANTRWGVPTINSKEGISHAIVVGDYLLALSANVAASVSNEVVNAITTATLTVCDGQSQETADEYNINRSIDTYMATISQKTAALTAVACRVGGLCAGLPEIQIDSLSQYGEAFGISFQLIDDLLDFISTSEAMGKPVGNDMKGGVYTLPLLLALQSGSKKQIRNSLSTNPTKNTTHKQVVEALSAEDVFEETIKVIRQYNKNATEALKEFDKNAVVTGLTKLPTAYLKWVLEHKVVSKRI